MEAESTIKLKLDAALLRKLKQPRKNAKEVTMRLIKSSSTNLFCAVCFAMNGRACQGCHNIAYCSREHQILHWSTHQLSCKPLVTLQKEEALRNLSIPPEERIEDPYAGSYRTLRYIKSNETVLQIQPIMHVAHNKGLPAPPDSVLCLGCNRWYQHSQGYRCTKCKWPVCSERCETDSCHTKYECTIFHENKVYPPVNPAYFNGDIVLALRCLMLKEMKPADWEQLIALEPVVDQAVRPRHCLEADERVAKYLIYNCRVQDSLGVTFQEVMDLMKVIDFCSVWLPERSTFLWDNQYSFVSAKYVFPARIFVVEECTPNCSWSLNHSPRLEECSIRLRAIVDINAGHYLTASFSGISEYGASFSKRYENCRFEYKCNCRRCLDPTEGGSFFSGVKCPVCEDSDRGYLLPEDPSDHDGQWRCFNFSCSSTVSGLEVTQDVNRIHKDIMENCNSLQGLLSLIKTNEGTKLHRNHYLIMKATQLSMDLCWGVCQNSAIHVIGCGLLEKAKALTEKLKNIYRQIYPWNSIQNAKLLFYHQMIHGISKVRELLWLIHQNRASSEGSVLWPNEFWNILEIQKSAVDILIHEPVGSMERECAILLKGVMEDSESLLLLERPDSPIKFETLIGLQKVYSRYCSGYTYSVLPVFEDKELNQLLLFTGPFCKDM